MSAKREQIERAAHALRAGMPALHREAILEYGGRAKRDAAGLIGWIMRIVPVADPKRRQAGAPRIWADYDDA